MSIFVASGGDHAELKLPHSKVGRVATGEFAFGPAPSIRRRGVTGEEYSARRHRAIEPDGSEAVAGGTLVAEEGPDFDVSAAFDN